MGINKLSRFPNLELMYALILKNLFKYFRPHIATCG